MPEPAASVNLNVDFSQGDVTITHSAPGVAPDSNMWSEMFLAQGSVMSFPSKPTYAFDDAFKDALKELLDDHMLTIAQNARIAENNILADTIEKSIMTERVKRKLQESIKPSLKP